MANYCEHQHRGEDISLTGFLQQQGLLLSGCKSEQCQPLQRRPNKLTAKPLQRYALVQPSFDLFMGKAISRPASTTTAL